MSVTSPGVSVIIIIKQSSPPMIALRLPTSSTVLALSYAPPCPVNLLSSTLSSSLLLLPITLAPSFSPHPSLSSSPFPLHPHSPLIPLPPPPHYPCTLILPSSLSLLLPITLAPSFLSHPSPSPFPTEATIETCGTTRRRRCGSHEPRGSSPASRPPTTRKAQVISSLEGATLPLYSHRNNCNLQRARYIVRFPINSSRAEVF